jgi:hypothetical protein
MKGETMKRGRTENEKTEKEEMKKRTTIGASAVGNAGRAVTTWNDREPLGGGTPVGQAVPN